MTDKAVPTVAVLTLEDEKASEESIITIPSADCRTLEVTVFNDRAEVTRLVKLDSLTRGQHTVLVTGLSQYMDKNSVRANGRGNIVLRSVGCEVNFPKTDPKAKDSAAAELAEKIRVIKEKIAVHDLALRRSQAEFNLLQTFVNGVVSGGVGNKTAPSAPGWVSVDAEKLKNVSQVMDFFRERTEAKDKRDAEIKENKRKDQLELKAAETEQRTRRFGNASTVKPSNDVKVVIEAEDKLDAAEIILTYMVSGASWTPSYDLRAQSTSTNVQLTYYGTVRQSTGESWNGVNLYLSTAKPQVGGTPPELPTKTVSFAQPVQAWSMKKMRRSMIPVQAEMMNVREQSLSESESLDLMELPLRDAKVAVAQAETSGAGAATFKIAAVTDVESDNKPQKVTICILNMSTLMSHFCVPTESPHAYLQCKTTNESAFELLASDEVNVFFDGSFISTSKMPSVSPGESFQSFLGADSSVKIDSTPPFKKHTQGGYWSKTRSTRHTLVTKVKNTKQKTSVFVICSKQLPRSSDRSITVTPVSPSPQQLEAGANAENAYAQDKTGKLKPPMNYVKLHETKNNVVWKRIVKPQEETTFKLEYVVEWPKAREVQFR